MKTFKKGCKEKLFMYKPGNIQTTLMIAFSVISAVIMLCMGSVLIVCQTLIEHLRARKETRWHSFGENTDYPEESSKWLKYVNSKRKPDGGTEIIFRELVTGGKVYECTDFTE